MGHSQQAPLEPFTILKTSQRVRLPFNIVSASECQVRILGSGVSVVVETANALRYGVHLLFQAIESIHEQHLLDSEILVVDTGLPACTRQSLLDKFRQVRIVDAPNAGYFQAKNLGCENAHGSVVVFLDSDCVASDGWLKSIVKPFSSDAKAVAGLTLYRGSFLAKVMNVIDWGHFGPHSAKFTMFFNANNVALRKEIARFDERLSRTGAETVLANAMLKKGIRIYFRPSARVYHYLRYRPSDFIEVRMRQGFHVIETRKRDPSLYGGRLLAARALAPIIFYFGMLARDGDAIRKHRRTMTIAPVHAPVIFVFAIILRFIDMIGMMLTLAAPGTLKKKFGW